MNTEQILSLVNIDGNVINKTVEQCIESDKFEEILKRWTNFGFLDDLNDEQASRLAVLNEQLAAMLLNDDFDKYFDVVADNIKIDKIFENENELLSLNVALFPMLRKLFVMGSVSEINDFAKRLGNLHVEENAVNEIMDNSSDRLEASASYCNYICNEIVKG